MQTINTPAVAIDSFPIRESDRVAVLFTRQLGKVRAVAGGARKLKSQFGAALEPLTLLDVTLKRKENQDLMRMTGAEIVRSYFPEQSDPETAATFAYLAELTGRFMPDADPSEVLFRLLCRLPEAIEQGLAPSLAARYFEVWTLRCAGLFPDLGRCAGCDRSFAASGESLWFMEDGTGVLCDPCRRESQEPGRSVSFGVLQLARAALRKPPEEFATTIDSQSGDVIRLGRILQSVGRQFLGRDPRSLAVLHRIAATETLIRREARR